ncbi:unnamed protein product [Parnassius apollo]|uniref:(apollo) hypothetical protein n=1 Tax=Parnassius apollo TaxID=110799 RepID=A0A8S3WCC6_PARAO|nr:unnamed protein product [Parnassius apollo]
MTLSNGSANEHADITLDMLNFGSDITDEQKGQLLNIVNEFWDCFALDTSELGVTNISEMQINLLDDSSVTYKPYRLLYSERLIVRDLVNDLLDNKIIQESNSSYARYGRFAFTSCVN